MNLEHEQHIIDAFKAAAKAAEEAGRDIEDGGTSNFDSPAFRLEGRQAPTVQRIAAQAGLTVSRFTWFGQTWFFLHVPLAGQGSRRSRMSQAAHAVLEQLAPKVPGFQALHYMQMD